MKKSFITSGPIWLQMGVIPVWLQMGVRPVWLQMGVRPAWLQMGVRPAGLQAVFMTMIYMYNVICQSWSIHTWLIRFRYKVIYTAMNFISIAYFSIWLMITNYLHHSWLQLIWPTSLKKTTLWPEGTWRRSGIYFYKAFPATFCSALCPLFPMSICIRWNWKLYIW